MNSQDEQRVNIKFCIHFHKSLTGMAKLLREAYRSECMAELMIHEWQALLCDKKGGQLRMSITETNIYTVRAIIRALEALLHIPGTIIHRIFTKKLKVVPVASVWVLHMLTSDQILIYVKSTSKFLGLLEKDSNYLSRVVTCDKTWVHHYHSLSGKVSIGRRK